MKKDPAIKLVTADDSNELRCVAVTIVGISPLLQSRMTDAASLALPGGAAKDKRVRRADHSGGTDPRAVAEAGAYPNADGTYGHPMSGIVAAMSEAGKSYKLKGTRRSVGYLVHAAVCQSSDIIGMATILDPETMKPAKHFEVDSRTAVNQKTKGRVMSHRACWHHWAMRFELVIEVDLVDDVTLHRCLEDAGRRVGIGAYRVQKGGPFGRFRVVEWREKDQAKVA